ncbi:hypothetical protein AMELA_G00028600 [Ameiurus melas]|uniref:Coiled-coil domain-containing protein 43 n=1 Tax=Ameiurus melas TaxID=219545 RepID=A0A7J6BD11_AMEME|nr:hypothetical protein AMELA_G00028600 [Ameiurus melas]
MAAPDFSAGEFEKWLNELLDGFGADREVYGVYILGVLQEEETDEEKSDALNGILSAFVDEDTLEEVCQQILKQWTDFCSRTAAASNQPEDEVQAIASLIEKQAQIVVRQKAVSEEAKQRKEALLAQYANVTDEEEYPLTWEDEEEVAGALGIPSDKSLFKNTNVEEVMSRRRLQREQAKEDAQKKKEQDKMQREKDKLTKQERKDREKKRTQKGERKR